MSRLAAYIGPGISLKSFLADPSNSLYQQARQSQESVYSTFNADGFGIGWYQDLAPQRYIMTSPIWHDGNLNALAHSLHSDLWLGVVRSNIGRGSATPYNAQPYVSDALLFMHDGFVEDFNHNLKPACLSYLSPDIASNIHGNSDSEYLFALLRQRMLDPDELTLEHALADILANLEVSLRDIPSLLNIVLSDGQRLIATRHATSHQCPSLYYTTDNEHFPGGQLIASEPLDDSDSWEPVLEHHIIILEQGCAPKISHI
jgi:glutamine amidotransferase